MFETFAAAARAPLAVLLRIKKIRKKLKSTVTERAISKKGHVENMRLQGSNKVSWSLIYLD
jgi:hypothetical protein